MATTIRKEPVMMANTTGQVTVSINAVIEMTRCEEQIAILRRMASNRESLKASEVLEVIGTEKTP